MQHEVAQQAKLRSGELDVDAIAAHALAAFIQLQACSFQSWLVGQAAGTAQQGLNAQLQFLGVKGLAEVVVRPGLQTFDAFRPRPARREDQHRRGEAAGTPLRQHLQARQARQAEVEDDQIIGFALALVHRVAAIGQPVHGVALALQAGGQFVGQGHVVFDKQQAHVSRLPHL